MICAGGGCALAIATRCSTACGKFRKLLPILTSKDMSPLTRGKVLSACVRSALLRGRETWAPTAPDLLRLHRNDRAMILSVKPYDKVPMETLHTKKGIQGVAVALRTKRPSCTCIYLDKFNYLYRHTWPHVQFCKVLLKLAKLYRSLTTDIV